MQICVIDVGGSHVSDGTFDVTDGQLLRRRTSTLFTDGSSHHPLKILHAIAEQSNGFSGEPIAGMSLAVPSPFDFVAGVSRMRHKLEQLYGIDLKRCLSEIAHIPFDSCVFLNDADAFLLGALTNSGSPNLPSLGIALGTGIGSAFADEGEILTSGIGVPPEGEIWNLSFEEGTIEDAWQRVMSKRSAQGSSKRR
jgi:glucokinase